jgi:DNA invertase Pin-like site-specific DNA recombinase
MNGGFSPRRHAEECDSIETQLDLCRAYCRRKGYHVAGEHEDRALSGSEEDRPGLWAAIDALKRGDMLVADKLDRLARDVYLAELIQREAAKRGASIETVEGGANGDTPEQRMIRQVLQAFAEHERKVIAARTRAAILRHQAAGRRMSAQPPYGWTIDPDDPARLVRGKK